MRLAPRLMSAATAGALAFAAGGALAFAPVPSNESLEFPLSILRLPPDTRTQELERVFPSPPAAIGRDWSVRVNLVTGTAHLAWGGLLPEAPRAVTGDAAAIELAQDFLASGAGVTGFTLQNSDVLGVISMPGKRAVHFQQIVNSLPVHTGHAVVLLSDAGEIAAFGSDFFPVTGNVRRAPVLSSAQALDAAARSISATPRAGSPVSQELAYVPDTVDEAYALRLAWRVVFDSDQPYGKWEHWVDAETGAILARRNFVHTLNVTGTAQGDVEDFGYCDGVATKPFENMRVNVSGGNNDNTDDVGFFDITHGGTAPVTVTAQFLGQWINVNRAPGLGSDASFSGSATPGTPFTLNWTNSNSRADERDAFFHGNRAHDFMKVVDPTFNGLDYAMPTSVGRTDGFCPGNAWWDGNGMNYCEASGNSANTARIGNVVYHEFGHGVTQEVYFNGPPSDLHEGNSDVLANLIDRQPIIGLGFSLNQCTSGIRNSDNNIQYQNVVGAEGHYAGQCIAGVYWDTWQAMLAALPQQDADDTIRGIWHLARKMGQPQTQPDQVMWTFLVDDDDAHLPNGTPHHEFICVGAANHGFDCPAITEGVFITHTPLATTENGAAGFDVDAIITSTEAALDPTELLLHYRVNGGSFNTLVMAPAGGADEYSAHIPSLNGNSEVAYYISAADVADNAKTSPANAPGGLYEFDVVHIYDTLENGVAGWQVGAAGDNATAGIWVHVDPIGTAGGELQAQPEDDATPAPGTLAWITGQCAPPACPFCTQGCSDVDNGTTTLTSKIYDLTGATQAKVKYARWYSNNTGAGPNLDQWTVDISNDGGTNWTNVENTTNTIPDPASSAEWTLNVVDIDALFGAPGQVRLRFRARDTGAAGIVEAGVDDLRFFAQFGGPVGVEDLVLAPATFSLEQNQPNPFSPMTRIDFAVPAKADVKLAVYDVTGREVRTLSSGTRDAGRYSVQWDGKDRSGAKVSAGMYFYRLTSGAETLTRKMTVLK